MARDHQIQRMYVLIHIEPNDINKVEMQRDLQYTCSTIDFACKIHNNITNGITQVFLPLSLSATEGFILQSARNGTQKL